MPDAALALFAKAPRPGSVKTRLAGVLGSAGAAEFHRRCVLDAWQRFAVADGVSAYLYCDSSCLEFAQLVGSDRFRLQRGDDLGERMRGCLDELLKEGFGAALIAGSDAPALPFRQIVEALAALAVADTVLGPSADGGFALIGARRTDPDMFRGVAWSRDDTRVATLDAMRAAGLTAVETPTWTYDVDLPRDLRRLSRDPQVSRCLREWLEGRPL